MTQGWAQDTSQANQEPVWYGSGTPVWLLERELPLPVDLGLDRYRLQLQQPPLTLSIWKEILPKEGRNERNEEREMVP